MKTIPMMAIALALAMGVSPVLAEDEVDQATQEKLTAQLVAQGYEVRKIEAEDGRIEAYALKDGKTYELYFDTALNLVETKEGGA